MPESSIHTAVARAQLAMWRHLQIEPGKAPSYDLCDYQDIHGDLNTELFVEAIRLVVRCTAALRLQFVERNGELLHVIRDNVDFDIPQIDFAATPDAESAAMQWMVAERRPFSLTSGPLFRFAILKLGDSRHYWYCHYHHLIVDGYGSAVIWARLPGIYGALLRSEGEAVVQDDSAQYQNYLRVDADYQKSAQCVSDMQYWQASKAGQNPVTLSVKTPQLSVGMTSSKLCRIRVPDPMLVKLMEIARQTNVRLPQFMIAIVLAYLQKACRVDMLTVGLPTHGRTEPELQGLAAACANVLPASFMLNDNLAMGEFAMDVASQLGSILQHRRYRHEDIRRVKGLKLTDPPLYRVSVNVLILPEDVSYLGAQVSARVLTPAHADDLTIYVFLRDGSNTLSIQLDGNSSLYSRWELDSHVDALIVFMQALAIEPKKSVNEISLCGARADARGSESMHLPNNHSHVQTIHERVLATARRTPDAMALKHGRSVLSYGELDAQSCSLSDTLQTLNIGPGHLVGIFLTEGIDWFVALLSVLRAGAAFLPLDKSLPSRRLELIVSDANPSLIVTESNLRSLLPVADSKTLCIDNMRDLPMQSVTDQPSSIPRECAYCIYTSGSTGAPKGVMVSHANVLNHSEYMWAEFDLKPSDKVLQFSLLSFDASIEEIMPTWFAGAALIVPGTRRMSLAEFSTFIEEEEISVVNLPVAYWHQWVDALGEPGAALLPDTVRLVVVGGEQVKADKLRKWRDVVGGRNVEWINTYGPTEATVSCTTYKLGVDEVGDHVPVGRPILGTRLYVTDRNMNELPVGLSGEIVIGGESVSLGYLNNSALTREKYFSERMSDGLEERLYRTGDFGRRLPNGHIEIFGRLDRQIKIRGFRVEPAEIEAAIRAFPQVRDCAVQHARSDRQRDKLVAFLVARGDENIDVKSLAAFLTQRLPEFMMPSKFIEIRELPTGTTGKIDFSALETLRSTYEDDRSQSVEPRTDQEHVLARIWMNVLKLSDVGVDDDFFDLGGDSIAAIQMLAEVKKITSIEVSMRAFLSAPRISQIAVAIEHLSLARNRDRSG
jgi:amino acid adenylation domain-containing protein